MEWKYEEYAKKLASDVLSFQKNIYTEIDFFDIVVFRGTLHLVDTPFEMLRSAWNATKPGGFLCILATPNLGSPLYKIKSDLPFIEWDRIHFLTDEKTLINVIKNLGYIHLETKAIS